MPSFIFVAYTQKQQSLKVGVGEKIVKQWHILTLHPQNFFSIDINH